MPYGTDRLNGLSRAAGNLNRNYGLSGTEPVINQECMLVHEKSGQLVKLSGTAIMMIIITASNDFVWGGFLYYLDRSFD